MHETQKKLLELARERDLSRIPLRSIAEIIGHEPQPAVIKHHLKQLEKKGLLVLDKVTKTQRLYGQAEDERVVQIPVLGAANCGEALTVADDKIEGFIDVSARTLRRRAPSLIALRTLGDSMNKAQVPTGSGGKAPIEEGDYVIVDTDTASFVDLDGEYVVSIVNGMANIKKLLMREHDIALVSESTRGYPPIVIDTSEQNYFLNGRVVQVIKRI
jgi:SOS-response transcriptional repressor LexA